MNNQLLPNVLSAITIATVAWYYWKVTGRPDRPLTQRFALTGAFVALAAIMVYGRVFGTALSGDDQFLFFIRIFGYGLWSSLTTFERSGGDVVGYRARKYAYVERHNASLRGQIDSMKSNDVRLPAEVIANKDASFVAIVLSFAFYLYLGSIICLVWIHHPRGADDIFAILFLVCSAMLLDIKTRQRKVEDLVEWYRTRQLPDDYEDAYRRAWELNGNLQSELRDVTAARRLRNHVSTADRT